MRKFFILIHNELVEYDNDINNKYNKTCELLDKHILYTSGNSGYGHSQTINCKLNTELNTT